VGAYGSAAIELVVTLFMVLAGVNFALHFKLLRGKPLEVLRDSELRLYGFVLGGGTVLLASDLLLTGRAGDVASALRLGGFQTTTIVTTTGYATADFDTWSAFSRALLFMLMFVGGCAGSTGGSVKVVRAMIVCKKLVVDLKRMVQPNAVLPVRVGRRAIPEEVVTSVTTFLIMFMSVFAAGGLILAMFGLDLVTAYSASAACLGNIGPGFGLVGPTRTYAPLPPPAKLVLVGMMIIGRLELYTVLVTLLLGRGRM
jgi:trk system potassium uptake protein TrkH